MTLLEMHRLISAHDAIWTAWWPTLVALPADAASRHVGGYANVLATTTHLVDAERYWQEILDAGPPFGVTIASAETLGELHQIWADVQARRLAWLATADPDAAVTFVPDAGGTATVRAWECVAHVVSHAHFHRGQLVWLCRALGVRPPSRHLVGAFIGEF